MSTQYKFPAERKKLLKMGKRDQMVRTGVDFTKPESGLAMSRVDIANQKKLIKILETINLPSTQNIGIDGAKAVWLVGQHASNDLALMKDILQRMRKAMRRNSQNGYYRGIPYLVDRINVIEGKPQLYGTQFWGGGEKPTPYPIIAKDSLDKRRTKFSLQSFTEYQKEILKNHHRHSLRNS